MSDIWRILQQASLHIVMMLQYMIRAFQHLRNSEDNILFSIVLNTNMTIA